MEKYKVYILSAVPTVIWDQVVFEKDIWLDKYLPIPKENRLYIPEGANKALTASRITTLNQNVYLIDDYNHHLEVWQKLGGTGIKFVNTGNHKGLIGPKWEGLIVRHDNPSNINLDAIL